MQKLLNLREILKTCIKGGLPKFLKEGGGMAQRRKVTEKGRGRVLGLSVKRRGGEGLQPPYTWVQKPGKGTPVNLREFSKVSLKKISIT